MKTQVLVAVMTLGLIACGGKGTGGTGGGTGSTGGGSGGSGGSTGGGSGGSTGGGTASTGGGSGGSGGSTGGGSGGGSGNVAGSSCTNPLTAVLGAQAPGGVLNAANKKIHYRVAVTAGDFLVMVTNANPTNDTTGTKVDATVTVYNEAGTTVLASIDDAYPKISTDTTLFYKVPTTGNICVMVADYDTWASTGMSTAHTDDVKLTIAKLDDTAVVNNGDTGSNNDASTAQVGKIRTLTMGTGGYANVYGTLDSQTDVDVYKFTMPVGVTDFSVNFAPIGDAPALGTNSYGSSLSRIAAKITSTTGTVIGQLVIPTMADKAPTAIGVPVTAATDYLLWIERPAGSTAGANDFYACEVEFFTDNPPEAADATNGVQATAEALTLTVNATNAKLKSGFILGALTASDVDIYSFNATANDTITLGCGAMRTGSGLRGTTFEILSATASLQSETEIDSASVSWGTMGSKPAVTAATTGMYFLKVSGATQDATVTGNWYRCGVHVTSP